MVIYNPTDEGDKEDGITALDAVDGKFLLA